ncbi:MAG: TrmJ/YjtD family RNA methyltransferase [Alphaproteobacteria bacterium]|nr:TrmJ/YjtD family RNA methyltransferase [Alphaproteobacteria bacterium]
MPGAGTDKTKNWVQQPGPVVILVEPQLGENIGSAARAMANFGLGRLRLVKPRDGWPNPQARKMASGADRILDDAVVYDRLEEAIADCSLVLATTARAHDQAKPVVDAGEAAQLAAPLVAAGETVGILFGRERIGLENQEVALADRIITLPVNPAFASLNLGQAVVIVAYEWFKLAGPGLPFTQPYKSPQASKYQLLSFFASLEGELEKVEFFRPPDKRATMQINLRNILTRMTLTQQDIRTLHGVITAIADGRKGPARGGLLNGDEAALLRTLLAEHSQGRVLNEHGPVRGLARLLRRNPTEAERVFWDAFTRDRRFIGQGFKRQVPVGPHITDVVSFPLRVVIEMVPADEVPEAIDVRSLRRTYFTERGYRVLDVAMAEVEVDVAKVLGTIAVALSASPSAS